MRQAIENAPLTLNSWKEIATYLDRGVRTVQRWERELQLPVHRIGKGKRSPVFALSTELDFWMTSISVPKAEGARQLLQTHEVRVRAHEQYLRLKSNYPALVHALSENAVRLKRQVEILQKRIVEIKSAQQRIRNNHQSRAGT